jgi:hypothetical protein
MCVFIACVFESAKLRPAAVEHPYCVARLRASMQCYVQLIRLRKYPVVTALCHAQLQRLLPQFALKSR